MPNLLTSSQRQQIYDKWYNFFYNLNPAQVSGRNIQIPDDDNERAVAQQAAQDVVSKLGALAKANYQTTKNVTNQVAIINQFLRRCASYVKQRTKNNDKELKALSKQGAATYSQQDLKYEDNIISKVDAATKLANNAVYLYKQGNEASLRDLTTQLQESLKDPTFKTVFTYKYYSQTGRDVSNLQLKYDDVIRDYNEAKAGNSNMVNSLGFSNQNLAGRSYDYLQKQKQQKQQGGQ